jgi:hypothetical protein
LPPVKTGQSLYNEIGGIVFHKPETHQNLKLRRLTFAPDVIPAGLTPMTTSLAADIFFLLTNQLSQRKDFSWKNLSLFLI